MKTMVIIRPFLLIYLVTFWLQGAFMDLQAGDIKKEILKKKLTEEQYRCTQEGATERPFANLYWNNHEDGLYVDVVDHQPLFLSLDKYDSGSGWPSFTRPIDNQALTYKEDKNHSMTRTEVKSQKADSHLGHVFDDGPGPTHKRYCINSAAMRFVPLDQLKKEGFGHYLFNFASKKGWETATVAGGCFWGLEHLLTKLSGVIFSEVGYSGGELSKASYDLVKTGKTGHAEAVRLLFDPKKISYEEILLYFFKIHDPTTLNQQGNDRGSQYRSVIFYENETQYQVAQKVIKRVEQSGQWKKKVVTELTPFHSFGVAENEHQNYLERNPLGYSCHFERKLKF